VLTVVTDSLTLHVRNKLEALAPATEAAEHWLAEQQAPPEAGFLVVLAIDELVTNCIKYGYDDPMSTHRDHAVVRGQRRADGRRRRRARFRPLKAPKPDLTLRIEDRKIGGLGLHLLRELSTTWCTSAATARNRLTLTKRLA